MKQILLIAGILVFSFSAEAYTFQSSMQARNQREPRLKVLPKRIANPYPNKKIQFGINASDFIRQYLVINSNNLNLPSNPYDFNAKYFPFQVNWGNGMQLGFRTGMAFRFDESGTTSNNSSSNFVSKSNLSNIRLGMELQDAISPKFTVFYGLDYFISRSKSETINTFSSGSSTNTTSLKSRGGQLVFGLQFLITPYLNVNTEANLGYFTSESSTVFVSTGSGSMERVDAGSNRSFFFNPPSFVNLNILF